MLLNVLCQMKNTDRIHDFSIAIVFTQYTLEY